ncbi:YihY/virulence factor BrkB family protein [Hydrogenophaga sp. 2FB]|uniref:YihY/virulence factor BrkB family protein n=1 Tax=Hydrogenophaga sp. 2FB TaxID=2502187 RepID=UPI0010F5B872|nr:YihY/virulence factor BrkB family protein [Hydrogenophaga sp. 2FB]
MIVRVLRATVVNFFEDGAPSMGAALAFYTLFSIAPVLLIVISVAGLLFGEAAARGEIFAQLTQLVGTDSAVTINSLVEKANQPSAGIVGTLVGLGTLFIGATTVFAELRNAMDRIWRTQDLPPRHSGIVELLRSRLMSFGLVLAIGFLLMVSLVLSAALAALSKWAAPWLGELAVVASAVDFALSLAFLSVLFAMIFKWMPRVKLAWADVWIGAAITAVLLTVGKALIGTYIGRSGVASVFGAASSLVIFLLWVYYSAQVFLLGAEFTRAFAQRHEAPRAR